MSLIALGHVPHYRFPGCLRLIRTDYVKVLNAIVPRLQHSIQPCAAFPYVSAGSPLMLTHSPLAASTSPGSLLACGLGF